VLRGILVDRGELRVCALVTSFAVNPGRGSPAMQDSRERIESLDESDLVRKLVHGADAAACNRVAALSELVVDRASAELGSTTPARCLSTLCCGKARFDLPRCRCKLSPYVLFHLKASTS